MYQIFLLEPGAKIETETKRVPIYGFGSGTSRPKIIGYKTITTETAQNMIELPPQGLPEELEMAVKINNVEDSVLNLGDVVVPGTPGLREYKLEFVLPHTGAVYRPIQYLNFFRSAAENKKVLRLIITRGDMQGNGIYNTDISVVIKQYSVKEKFGCVGDQFVDMTLKEYREHSTQLLKANTI